LQSYSRSIR